jgi:hypothetical protein
MSEVKFKNRYNDKVIDMDVYETLDIDAQWEYDVLLPNTWEYDRQNSNSNDETTVSGTETPDRD